MALKSKRNVSGVRGSSGFTLIEMLVIISILSLLMAILLPALRKAKITAKRITCQANLRNIAMAWQMYLNDNNGAFYQGMNVQFLYGGWKGIYFPNESRPLNKYLFLPKIPKSKDNARVFKCPADKGERPGAKLSYYEILGTSYQTNTLLIGQDQIRQLPSAELKDAINARLKDINLSKVANPSRLLLVGDYGWRTQWDPGDSRGVEWHGRACHHNIAFLDCHVEFLEIRKGIHITDKYTVIPFKELYGLARSVQVEVPCED